MVFKINRMNEVLPKVKGDTREKVDKIRVVDNNPYYQNNLYYFTFNPLNRHLSSVYRRNIDNTTMKLLFKNKHNLNLNKNQSKS